MTNSKTRMFVAVVGALSIGTAAWAAEPSQDQRIAELESKLANLETKQAANSKDIAATIDSVLRDAEKRSQLLAAGDSGAGYDNGFFIRMGDAWVLKPGAQFQFRGVADFREDAGADEDTETETGFEVRRMKLMLHGSIVTKDLTYGVVWATNRDTGAVFLEDAWGKYALADDWAVKAGQYKDPVHHEELVSSSRQLAADRSLLNEILGGGYLDRTQGVSLIYGNYTKNNPVYGELMVHDGANQDNTNYIGKTAGGLAAGTPASHSFDFGVTGRLEWKHSGDWKAYQDFSAMGNKEDLLVLGGGVDWSQSGDGDVITGTVDGQWENSGGLGIYGAVLVQNSNEELVGGTDDVTDWGFLLQAGYMLNEAWELFGRYDGTYLDSDVVFANGETEDTFHEITVGLNYFLGTNGSAGHKAKITVDLTYLPNGAPGSDSGLGILGDTNGEAEWVVRGQFQLVI